MPKGSIKSWRRDRGFGFINVDGQEEDVFVHISELRSLGRQPRIGDEINFSIETQENGKVRAINCNVKDDNQSSNMHNSNRSTGGKDKTFLTISVVAVALILCIWIYFFVLN